MYPPVLRVAEADVRLPSVEHPVVEFGLRPADAVLGLRIEEPVVDCGVVGGDGRDLFLLSALSRPFESHELVVVPSHVLVPELVDGLALVPVDVPRVRAEVARDLPGSVGLHDRVVRVLDGSVHHSRDEVHVLDHVVVHEQLRCLAYVNWFGSWARYSSNVRKFGHSSENNPGQLAKGAGFKPAPIKT